MIKKLLSLVCCVLPMGVRAAPQEIAPIGADAAVATTYDAWQSAIAGGQSIVVSGGNGINATGGQTTGGVDVAPGFDVTNNMIVGLDLNPGTNDATPNGAVNNLYVLNSASSPFTVISTGDISIGSMLQVLNGVELGFKTSDTNPEKFSVDVGADGIKIGNAINTASLTLDNINVLDVAGSVIAYGDFSVDANSVNVTGGVNLYNGTMNIDSAGAVTLGELIANDNVVGTAVSGQTITVSGDVSNQGGDMELIADDDVNITGSLENSVASNLSVSGADLVVTGTVKNDEADGGTLTLNVDSWRINGGNQNTYSLVNNGNLYATVDGETYMEYGLNLTGMGTDNEFSLTTGTLVFGANADSDKWFGAFANNLNKFNVNITGGDLDNLTTVLNGANGNTNATMTVAAQNIVADSVQNDATSLTMNAQQNMTINGAVQGNAGTTKLVAANTLSVVGAVSNSANTVLNGNVVNVASLSNSGVGAELTVSSLTEASGTVNVSGDITNTAGTTTVWAKNVDIDGTVTNNSGTTTIRGSDANGGAVAVGGIDAAGGAIDLIALAGNMAIDNNLAVSNGVLNIDSSLRNLTVGGTVQIAGNMNVGAGGASAAGDMNVVRSDASQFAMTSNNAILISGDVNAVDSTVVGNVALDAPIVNITGNATVANSGHLTLGTKATSYIRVAGDLTFNDGGIFETYAQDLVVGSLAGDGKFMAHGAGITANNGNIDIDGNIYFDADNDPVDPSSGMVVRDTTTLTLKTTLEDMDISVGAVSLGDGNTLVLNSADALDINGVLANNGTLDIDAVGAVGVDGATTNTGTLDLLADSVSMAGINNSGNAQIVSTNGEITAGGITNSGSMEINAATDLVAGVITHTAGVMDLDANSLSAQSLGVSGATGSQVNVNAPIVAIAGNAKVSGNFVQGGTGGMLNLTATDFSAQNLTITGDFIADAGNTTYDVTENVSITGNINVADGSVVSVDAGNRIVASDLTNAGRVQLSAGQGIELDEIINESGAMSIDSGAGLLDFASLVINGGNLTLRGVGMDLDGAIATGANLYQNWGSVLAEKDINIVADDYEITTAGLDVATINQDGKLLINTSDVDVGGDIIASDLQLYAMPRGNWMNVSVGGNVSGNVDFVGLEKMTIAGNYMFNDGSQINAAILPHVAGGGANASGINYWASVSLNDDATLGEITNATDGDVRALITVGGKFESDLNTLGALSSGGQLGQPQIGIDIFDIVDQGTAIWFLHAEDGVADLATKIRNLNVSFCNADGSLCYDYLTSLNANNGSGDDLPAYVSVRDVNDDGVSDSLYIVFDPRFGGPVEVFKIQPIVARTDEHTRGEYVSAGALDNMIAGQLVNKQFYNRTPIEVIPLIFDGTNLSTMANELYNRMEDYVLNRDGGALARFSRLFQVREIEQIAGAIALNEHTSFRSFEDRMFDEFIWNRNRNLNKAWLDVDYGMFYQNIDDGKRADGHRFSVAGGFDWQESNTLVLGLTGRVSHTTSKAGDAMDLSYAGETQFGDVKIDVADTNVGLGGYLMKILGQKTRLYGNAFLDLHLFDVDRTQNFVDRIDGDGTAFSLMSEWGLMHDILNQYIVGNAYARVGYNFGFSVKEKAAGDDYMRLKSDGYFVLTPGYSLIAQKRIYPSAWFQIRPYASIGIEYDVFGAPDFAKYKFAVADDFTKYDIDIDPLWANIGGGVELLSARGIQFGIDYRYQYNDAIQLHNIKVSGSYRF
ncbi:MAG: hypothetical protein IJW84_01755 [Alphaproteobacteria bacterium]|nr:hypothetical protein [Alphaproteobacteria bacterium]